MRIALFGRSGQVATEVRRRAPDGVELEVLGRDRAEFTAPDALRAAARAVGADAFINAAAYTAVDAAESDEERAFAVNATAPGILAQVAAERGLPLVHISTDYVFDGSGAAPWKPEDPTGPLGAYGRSKLAGETRVRDAAGRHAILRTSWVFSAHGANFAKTMLRLGAERDRLTVVADQHGGPTPAAAIAEAVLALAERLAEGGPLGTYHFAGTPDTTWAGFARAIMETAGLTCDIADIASADWPTPARRPLNSRLDCQSLMRDHGIARPDWRAGLKDVIGELART